MTAISNLKNSFGKISIGVWGCSVGCMLIAISTTMTFSISPFFVTEVLGLSICSMGWIEGVSEGLSQLSKLVAGYLGDFFRRRKTPLIFGALLAAASKPIFILAGSAGAVILSKVIERISNGVMATPRDAYVAASATEGTKGMSLGLMMTLKTLGCTIGSLFIGALVFFTENYRVLLWLGFIPCALAVFILFRFMPDEAASKTKAEGADQCEGSCDEVPEKKSTKLTINWADIRNLSGRYWSLILVASLFMCARFSDGFLVLRVNELGAPKWFSTSLIGMFNIVSALCCLPIGHISDRFDRSRLLYFSFFCLVLTNILLITNSLSLAIVGVIFWGAQRGTSQVLFSAIIADEAPKKILGTAMGIFYLVTGITSFIAGVMAGETGNTGLTHTFYFGLGASSIALIALLVRNEIYSRLHPKTDADLALAPTAAEQQQAA